MPRPSRAATALLLAAPLLLPSLAQAAPITRTFAFSASDFELFLGRAPVSLPTVTGTFTVTFDTATNENNQTAGITLDALSIPSDFAVAYTYDSSSDFLAVGGLPVTTVILDVNDFYVGLQNASTTTPTLAGFIYASDTLTGNAYSATVRSVAIVPPAVATPEPASLALLGAGLLALAASRRRA